MQITVTRSLRAHAVDVLYYESDCDLIDKEEHTFVLSFFVMSITKFH